MDTHDARDTPEISTRAEEEDQVVDDGFPELQVGLSEDDHDLDIVDWASDNSFPASDPPPWTPGIG